MKKEIQQIFMNELKEKVVDIKDVSRGVDQIVKIVQTENSTYIIKLPKKDVAELLMREYIACKKLNGLGSIPKFVAKNNKYLIEEFIPGYHLDEVSLNLTEKKNVYKELGTILKKIHSISMEGYGSVGVDGKGKDLTLKDRVFHNRNENLKYLKENFLLEKEYLQLLDYLKNNDFYADSRESVMLHFDFAEQNIKINNKKVVGILDFGDLSAGPLAFDLARLFIGHSGDDVFQYFLKGYGKVDLNEVKYYSVINLLWMLPYHHKINKNKKRIELELKVLNEII